MGGLPSLAGLLDEPKKHRSGKLWLRSKDFSAKRPASEKLYAAFEQRMTVRTRTAACSLQPRACSLWPCVCPAIRMQAWGSAVRAWVRAQCVRGACTVHTRAACSTRAALVQHSCSTRAALVQMLSAARGDAWAKGWAARARG